MRVDVEEIYGIKARRKQINSIPLKDIEFYQDGKRIEFDKSAMDEWRFVGMSNIDFIELDFQNDYSVEERTYPPSPLRKINDN
jgi:hypothetical protein